MRATRRAVTTGMLAGMAALALAGCGGEPVGRAGAPRAPEPVLQPVPNAGFDAWVAGFRPRAQAQGISAATFDAAFRGAGYLPGVVERDRNQTEFTRTLQDYLAIAASDERVAMGRDLQGQYGALLAEI
jgi:membrane-bound lytic murein transglycosylase B